MTKDKNKKNKNKASSDVIEKQNLSDVFIGTDERAMQYVREPSRNKAKKCVTKPGGSGDTPLFVKFTKSFSKNFFEKDKDIEMETEDGIVDDE
eukprot:CAMPEP_0116900096 /NCGR_PEP_ID=MMETSP0467-20121206/8498_1 /TAXON_ID=283647 /ORGANISM="Mesodinium pulex, Strain SPMC105" /LENGTH=92 /DNA_ID=CAMNT_0004573241 /DNA_START=572 /DNA_END=850 /DNA_ORIENTATION=+